MQILHNIGLVPPLDLFAIACMFLGSVLSGVATLDRDQRSSAAGITLSAFLAIIVGSFAPMILACVVCIIAATLIATMSSGGTTAFIVGNTNGISAGLLTATSVSQYGVVSYVTGELLFLWVLLVLIEYTAFGITHALGRLQKR